MTIDLNPKNELDWVAEGRVYHAHHGALTTVAAFHTDLVRQQPTVYVRVPAGVVIVPLRVTVQAENTGAAIFQVLISTGSNDAGTGNITEFDAINVNSEFATRKSKVFAYITTSGATGTAPASPVDVHRVFVPPRIDAMTDATASPTFTQVIYAPLQGRGLPCVVGQIADWSHFMVMVGNGTSADGYAVASWAEFTYDEFYA